MRWRANPVLRVGIAAALLIAAAALLLDAGLPQRSDYTQIGLLGSLPIAPEINASAPPFDLITRQGTIRFSDLLGKPLVINFWATWCVPCEVELPELQAFQDAHPDAAVIGVNVGEDPGVAEAWAAERGVTFPITFDQRGQIAGLYAVRGMPTTFLVAPNGIILHIFFGATTRAALENRLALSLTQ